MSDDRVVRRVIKKHRRIGGVGLQVPHAHCCVVPRDVLVRIIEPDELHVDPQALPDQVVLFTGNRSALTAGDPGALIAAWRNVFHGKIHQAFDGQRATRAITPASIRARIHRIGQIEFDEIRTVLRQEDLLFATADDADTYGEFVAIYLELRQFAPRTLERTFPLLDLARVDAAIALDLDAEALLAASRPASAPEAAGPPAPSAASEVAAAEPASRTPIADGSARAASSTARARGNRARAAILALRAGDRDQARQDLTELCARLAGALGCTAPPSWADALLPVAELAASQRVLRFTAGARLLHDLQTACVVAERQTRIVDFFAWATSLGKRPLVRALPATREVRVAKHLHTAARKLAGVAPLAPAEHARLSAAVHAMIDRANAQVRLQLRPKIEAALAGVELRPHNLPERVAEKKLVDELLDHVVDNGRFSIGNLRDALSHNDLKIPDLKLRELASGDELLRCDRALTRSLDGVYRRGEGYLRFLQKLSSTLFGTPLGRFLSLYIILPLLGAFTVLKGLEEMIGLVAKHTRLAPQELATPEAILVGAVFLFLLIHLTPFRRVVVLALHQLGRGLLVVFLDTPRALMRRPLVRAAWNSRFVRWVVKPGVPAALLFMASDGLVRWPLAAGAFVALALILNSRRGRRLQELTIDGVVRSGRHLRTLLFPSMVRWILQIFAELMEYVDRGLYWVDEWLRFKDGESRLTLVAKGVLGTIWAVFAYFLRLYVNLFIEPCINPIKHVPVVTVAAKLLVPLYGTLMDGISGPAQQVLGATLGKSFAAFTVFVIPGLAGFLVWELKENWKLYARTRRKTLHAVSIGHHGESMVGFLKPGFHSGTIPKQFTRLRRTAWKDDERGVAKHKEALHHVEDAIHKFSDRELVSVLNEASAFRITDIAVGHIAIGSNRVHIDLTCKVLSAGPAKLAFELQSGWIVASVPARGWLDQLDAEQRQIFEIALAGFYKRAGVDLVREQLEQVLAGDQPPPPYDISEEGLIVWPGNGYQTEAVYDLRAPAPSPRLRGAAWTGELPTLTGHRALYFREDVRWSVWTQVWEQLARHQPPLQVIYGPSLLRRPAPPPATMATA
ncbi:MAG TPA: hypothetical protein VGC42_09650 [Kofleriaceae bacterium]